MRAFIHASFIDAIAAASAVASHAWVGAAAWKSFVACTRFARSVWMESCIPWATCAL